METHEEEIMDYTKLLSPIKIGNVEVRNRIAFPPIDVKLSEDEENPVTDDYIEYLASLVENDGVGLIISEFTAVKAGDLWVPAIRIDKDEYISDIARIADGVREQNGVFFLQIALLGGRAPLGRTIAPSAIQSPYYNGIPEELSLSEIKELRNCWIDAAVRAEKAGCHGVELHGGHTYLLGEFISPHANQRHDEYGGDFKRRMQLPKELIEGTKEKLGDDFPVGFKISAYEIGEFGISPPLAVDIAEFLEEHGADYIHVSSSTYMVGGTKYPDVPSMYTPEGPLVPLAEEIKKFVTVPVIAVAGITSPDYAASIVNEDKADIVAVGRAMFADPHWAAKIARGREKDIIPCIRCNMCHKKMIIDLEGGVECSVNAGLLKPPLRKAETPKTVAVIGAGPAGIEAAVRLDEKGHDVTLYEKKGAVGGNARLGAVPDFKNPLNKLLEYFDKRLAESGVTLELNREIMSEDLSKLKADAMVIAVGSLEYIPPIPGIEQDAVILAKNFSEDPGLHTQGPGTACVIGAGVVGVEISIFLAKLGREVYCIDVLPKEKWITEEHPTNRFTLLEMMDEYSVVQLDSTNILEIGEKARSVRLKRGNIEYSLYPDTVVLAAGYKKAAEPAEEARRGASKFPELHIIGDASSTRDIHWAIREGYETAMKI